MVASAMMVAAAMSTSVVAMVATLVTYKKFITFFHQFCNYESTIFSQDFFFVFFFKKLF